MGSVYEYLVFQLNMQRQAIELISHSNPLTAYGVGLDTIAQKLGIRPREEKETDMSLRERIVSFLEYC